MEATNLLPIVATCPLAGGQKGPSEWAKSVSSKEGKRVESLSYPNFVRGPLLGGMQLVFGHFEVLGAHH